MSKAIVPEKSDSLIPISQNSLAEMKRHRALLAKFVKSQLVEADFKNKDSKSYGEGDYGVIPGTKKNCLFKQGAEKLMRLFSLGVRFKIIDKDIDRYANFAIYTYEAEVYLVKTGQVLATCQATANSQEVKYKERTEWITNDRGVREQVKVETPVFDVINTLQKMAQKRAMVGAVILATGASEYFSQDVLDGEDVIDTTARDVTPNEEPKKKAASFTRPAKPAETPKAEQSGPPVCCGQPMILSKYVDPALGHKPWYCMQCRTKLPAEEAS